MPKQTEPSGGARPFLPRWLRALWSWEEVARCGGHVLIRNTVTGERQAHRLPNTPHSAVPQQWVETGTHPCERPTPPSGGTSESRMNTAFRKASVETGAFRSSIFPHFDVDAPMPRAAEKETCHLIATAGLHVHVVRPRIRVKALTRPHVAA